jgi:hypothetical protein
MKASFRGMEKEDVELNSRVHQFALSKLKSQYDISAKPEVAALGTFIHFCGLRLYAYTEWNSLIHVSVYTK